MKAAQNVMRHYSVETTQKTMDWLSFVGVSAMIYVPRVVALTNRRKASRVVEASTAPQGPLDMQPGTAPHEHLNMGFTGDMAAE